MVRAMDLAAIKITIKKNNSTGHLEFCTHPSCCPLCLIIIIDLAKPTDLTVCTTIALLFSTNTHKILKHFVTSAYVYKNIYV